MFIKNLQKDLIDKIYTDVEIIFVDQTNTSNLYVHKVILASSSQYFDKMFTFGKENGQTQITIYVDNVVAARTSILSIYELIDADYLSNVKNLLEIFKCNNFFCINNDKKKLYNIKVPQEDFNLFLEILQEFDFLNDINLLSTLKKNIPVDYDLKLFPTKIMEKMATLENHKFFITAFDDNFCVWNKESEKIISDIKIDNLFKNCCAIHHKLSILAFFNKSKIFIWDIQNDVLLKIMSECIQSINALEFSPNGKKIVSGNSYGYIKIWDTFTGELTTIMRNKKSITSVAYTYDEKIIVSGSVDKTVKIWEASTGVLLNTFHGHLKSIICIALSMDNTLIASAGMDKKIIIHDFKTGQILKKFKGHTEYINTISFSKDDHNLVSGAADNEIKIWNIDTGTLYKTLKGHCCCIRNVTYTQDNLEIISYCDDKIIKIWDSNSGGLIKSIKYNNPTRIKNMADSLF